MQRCFIKRTGDRGNAQTAYTYNGLHQLFAVVTERDGEKDFYQGGMESYMTEGSED